MTTAGAGHVTSLARATAAAVDAGVFAEVRGASSLAGSDAPLDPSNLSPRLSSSLEWWFVQGRLETKSLGQHDFMLTLFRQSGASGQSDGSMLLLSTLDRKTGNHRTRSQVSRTLVENFVHAALTRTGDSELNRGLLLAYVEEIACSGPPRPIVVEESAMEMGPSTLSLRWDDVYLRTHGKEIEFAFALPGSELVAHFIAAPRSDWFEGRDLGGSGMGSMAYDCCPRLSIAGTVGNEDAFGEVWLDHQWGGHGWIQSPGGKRGLLGWDWLGINLDDGRDLLVMIHRDMETRLPIHAFAVLFSPSHTPRLVHDVAVTTGDHWTSPATMIDYPLQRRIEIPSIAVDIEFSPTTADQEIPVFGPITAIWEGSGEVNGVVGNRSVTGRARLELHGYGYLLDYKAYLHRWAGRINRTLASFLPPRLEDSHLEGYVGRARWRYDPSAQTEMLSRPVWDLLSRGGKHWRPIFGLLLLDALGVDPRPYERMFSVVGEFVHNGSVIVDDIEDQSLLRRGSEAIHLRYGLPTAINCGNLLYFLPLLTVGSTPELSVEQREAIYRIVFERFIQAHFGQAQDLHWSKPWRRGIAFWDDKDLGDLILQAYAFKTGAPIGAIADVACVIARADAEQRDSCVRLAESVGVAFQIVDDISNFRSGAEWGKVSGEDLAAGKVTYALHRAVRLLNGAEKRRLVEILESPELRVSQEGHSEGVTLIKGSEALDACRREAHELVDADWGRVTKMLPPSHPKLMLRLLFANLLTASSSS